MTVEEMENEFNLLYDNEDQEAPGLNSYEKSLYLTIAANTIVDKIIADALKKGSKGRHDDMYRLDEIKGLERFYQTSVLGTVPTEVDSPVFTSLVKIVPYSKYVKLPKDLAHVLKDYVRLGVADYTNVDLVSTRYEFITRQLRDPFKQPTPVNGYYKLQHGTKETDLYLEIISSPTAVYDNYVCFYIKRPRPIILEDLGVAYPGFGFSIDGFDIPYQPNEPIGPVIANPPATDLDKGLHRKIVKEAVKIAIKSYRENTLENNVQLDMLEQNQLNQNNK
jgi:hypothetical protein